MKKISVLAATIISLFSIISCSESNLMEETQISNKDGNIDEICITGKDFHFDNTTRSSVSISESGASFQWDEDDVIGIFPDKGDQVSFAMKAGAGTQSATFSGGGWALKSSAKYAAYYPHVYENRDLTAIPVSYVGQTQNGNANTDHIGAYDFMAASVSTPIEGAVAFDMNHLGCLVQLSINVAYPSTLNKIVLKSTNGFIQTGTIDLTAERPSITAKTRSNTYEIALNNISTTKINECATIYFMTAPIDMTEDGLIATIHLSDGSSYDTEFEGKELQAGKAYRFSIEIDGQMPNNQIWYTSSDGEIVEILYTDGFGATMISNTYKDGKGVIECDKDITSLGVAFFSRYNLRSISIPKTVKAIGDNAFKNCSELKEITIPNSITYIGDMAFSSSGLTHITLPNNLTTIGTDAFSMCYKLTDISIPASVSSIGYTAFGDCPLLTEIVVEDGNSVYDSRSNCNCIIETSNNTLTHGCIGSIIPNTVTTIGYAAFGNCHSLTNITIPESVTEIVPYAFVNCTSLTRVDIEAIDPPTIYNNTFSNCNNNLTFYVPTESVTTYSEASIWKNFHIQSSN